MCSLFAKAINPQVESTSTSPRLLHGRVMLLWMPWHSFQKSAELLSKVIMFQENQPSALCPQSGHRFIPLCQMANVFKLVKVGLHGNRSNSYPWRESWKPFWTLFTNLGMSAELGNLPRLDFAVTGSDRCRVCTDFSAPQFTKMNSLHWK